MSDRGLERRHLPPRPDEGVLREVFEYGFTRLDPVGGAHIDPPSVAVYETLLRKGPGGVALPGLASSWEESSDGLSCRVSLREGARFHSGRPCDAAAVLEALERCRYGPVDGLRADLVLGPGGVCPSTGLLDHRAPPPVPVPAHPDSAVGNAHGHLQRPAPPVARRGVRQVGGGRDRNVSHGLLLAIEGRRRASVAAARRG